MKWWRNLVRIWHAGIHQKGITKIQTPWTPQATACTISHPLTKIRKGRVGTGTGWWITQSNKGGNTANSIGPGQNFILWPSSGTHRPYVALHNRERASGGHKDHTKKHEEIVRLCGNLSKCNNEFLCLRHDNEHQFGCILPLLQGREKLCIQIFFHGLYLKGRRTNFPKRRILLPLCHPEVRCIVSSRGIIRRIVPEYESGEILRLTLKKTSHL